MMQNGNSMYGAAATPSKTDKTQTQDVNIFLISINIIN